MGDNNNNRARKSDEPQFDITSLLSKQGSSRAPSQQNKDSNLKYPNFWPTSTLEQSTSQSQPTSFILTPEKNRSPVAGISSNEFLPKNNSKSIETTLQEMSPDQLTNEGIEWVRIIKAPLSLADSDISDDEFILRCLTAESTSSNSSSIRWADDAVESEWTTKLQKQWQDIEELCASVQPNRPLSMSNTVYNECLEWRRAFPHQDSPRSSWPKGPQKSPGIGSTRTLSSPRTMIPFDDPQDYVHTWLSQCQQNSTGFSSLPIQSAKTKDLIRVLGEKGQFEEAPRKIATSSPPASLLEYRPRIKVQRPISSHVRGHTITPLSTGHMVDRDGNRRTLSKDFTLLEMIDEQQLSRSSFPKSPVEGHLIWSRHEHQVIQEESESESLVKSDVNNSRVCLTEAPNKDKTTKSFINWLFFDDNKKHS